MSLQAVRARLFELEANDKLEKLMAPVEEGMPWDSIAWMLQGPAILAVAIHVTRAGLAASASQTGPPAGDIAWLFVLGAIALALRYGWPLLRTAAQRRRLRLRRKGELAAAATVQVNDEFYTEGNAQWLPGSVLVSFDPRAWQDPDLLVVAARELFLLREADRRTLPAAHAAIAWDLYHEMWPVRSLPVPPELCSGLRDCRLATVLFPPEPFATGPLLVALAVRDELQCEGTALLPAKLGDAKTGQ